jgi:hypothetical protein
MVNNDNKQTGANEMKRNLINFANELRDLKPGYHFVQGIPVRVATVPVICGGPKMTTPQRVYEVLGRDFYDSNNAAAWAVS